MLWAIFSKAKLSSIDLSLYQIKQYLDIYINLIRKSSLSILNDVRINYETRGSHNSCQEF